MNERIRELAEQASEKIRYRIDPNTFKHIDDSNGPHTRFEFNKEKFAKLIVRECADISDASFHNGSAGYTAILKHFGVE